MLLKDWIAAMERIAPRDLAEEWDNPGLIVGTEKRAVHNVLVALDCTAAVAREAAERECELVLTHHPLLFHPVQRILPDDPETAAVYALIRGGVGLYAAHTNLDAAAGGVNDALAGLFGLTDPAPFFSGMGRVGMLEKAKPLSEFVQDVDDLLGADARCTGDPASIVARVAVLGGAGGEAVAEAKAAGADVLLTGEVKHHEALAAAESGMPLIVAGHYETEIIVLLPLIRRLQRETNDVKYHIARSGGNPFARKRIQEVTHEQA